eukprot:1162033-Pelagomonas_calceolata.AAC.2
MRLSQSTTTCINHHNAAATAAFWTCPHLVAAKAPPAPDAMLTQPRQRLLQHSISAQGGRGVAVLNAATQGCEKASRVGDGRQHLCK